jgi:hypothetical protein
MLSARRWWTLWRGVPGDPAEVGNAQLPKQTRMDTAMANGCGPAVCPLQRLVSTTRREDVGMRRHTFEYETYMRSLEWRRKRRHILHLAGDLCERCQLAYNTSNPFPTPA